MERRVLVAVFLSFLVLYGYQSFIVPPPPSGGQQSPPAPAAAPGIPPVAIAPSQPQAPAITVSEDPVASAALVGDTDVREIVVETATVQATLSNEGGRVVRWKLKDYRDETGELVDLVPSELPADQPTPFSLRVEDEAVSRRLNTALYRVTGATGDRLEVGAAGASLVFEFEDESGLRATKEFRFEQENYVVTFSARVESGGLPLRTTVLWGPGLGDIGAFGGGGGFIGNYSQPPQGIYDREAEAERVASSAIAEQPVQEGAFRFAGIDDHYFLAAALDPGPARIEFEAVSLPLDDQTPRDFVAASFTFEQTSQGTRFFYGPKQFDVLESVDRELVRAINFGFFGWLAVPLLGALQSIYGFVGNYGWSIILLTMCISIAVAPLRHKSVVSMRKMQAVQPQMKAIQERYAGLKATDPAKQKMNAEIMALYKEKGVNPAGGCLPMLLQFPVLLAFYSMLSQAIELRGAEFGWWIRDLSQPDPYYVIPVLMAGTMFWQTKITPSTADPAQQRIMMLMPLVFTVMFLWAPSGLVLYWFVSNLWAIGQQYFTNWIIGPAAVPAARPAAERQLKNAGAGRTGAAAKKS
jgi:YidC/Oxa1 family membrane protein insertase